MSTPGDSANLGKPLAARVQEWLFTEGYPLEFGCASVLREYGFTVRQGQHVVDGRGSAPREIDVLADRTVLHDDLVTRIHHVVECKYSRDKPWVVFTSRYGAIAPSACVAQTIGSLTGDTLLWALAGDASLQELDHFATPSEPGFGARQAFTKGQDQVYAALQSVTSLATLVATRHDQAESAPTEALKYAAIAFPVIVVDGELFEAHFDDTTGNVEVSEVGRIRLHWRGSASWTRHATLDIVRYSDLAEFAERRARDTTILADRLSSSHSSLRESVRDRDLSSFSISAGPRGLKGRPKLYRELTMLLSANVEKLRRPEAGG